LSVFQKTKARALWLWHVFILLGSLFGLSVCLKLGYGFVETAREAGSDNPSMWWVLLALAIGGALFFIWEIAQRIRLLREMKQRR
tara:strand:- start:2758 stop:3012 length:255 start_codon:yes stop_codon:yes gene_type:complete